MKASIVLIGCGPHAQRIYLPALQALAARLPVELALVIDLAAKEECVRAALSRWPGLTPELWFIDPFSGAVPDGLDRRLRRFLAGTPVNGAIIATEPLVHRSYAEWALDNGLNILLDKPVSAQADSVSRLSSADGILDDYKALLTAYLDLQRSHETIFVVNSQRRFHAGFRFVEGLLREVGERTNCPVTSVQSSHCDGQWRLPSEIVTQDYHPYCQGYGKASHSGYHLFDMLYRIYAAPGLAAKTADSMEVVSSFIQPRGFLKQYTEADYLSLFGDAYNDVRRWSDAELRDLTENYGEIDLGAMVTLKKDGEPIALLSVNMLHNGFARRTWLHPGADLYKGNGRVRHEQHNIQQGPFQNIQIHSYQSKDKHDEANDPEFELGGNNHFDIYVFRNPLIGGSRESLQVYSFEDCLSEEERRAGPMLLMEQAKHRVMAEFVDFLLGRKAKADIRSQIEDHAVPVQLMSGVYRSHILRRAGKPCVVEQSFGLIREEAW